MTRKTTFALLAALAALSMGTAYAGGDKADKNAPGATSSPSTTAPADPSASQKPMSKEEALANGVSEDAFKKADTNGDGFLDDKEIKAYNAKASGAKKQY